MPALYLLVILLLVQQNNILPANANDCNFEAYGNCYSNSQELYNAELVRGEVKDEEMLKYISLEPCDGCWVLKYSNDREAYTNLMKKKQLTNK